MARCGNRKDAAPGCGTCERRPFRGSAGVTEPYPLTPDQHPEGSPALPGYVWLDMPGKVRHVAEGSLEFTDNEVIGGPSSRLGCATRTFAWTQNRSTCSPRSTGCGRWAVDGKPAGAVEFFARHAVFVRDEPDQPSRG